MIRKFLTALAGFLTVVSCQAQTGAAKKAPSRSEEKSLLWRISGKGLEKPSYLFGTIHMICKDDYLWTPAMEQSLSKSDEVCFEMDLDDPTMMMQVMMGLMNTNGKKLKDYFSEAEYARLEKYVADSMGMGEMGLGMLQMMKPAALMTLFGSKGATTCSDPVSYEMQILETAKKREQEVVGLEGVSEQVELLDQMPTDSVVREIMDVVDGKQSKSSGEFEKLVSAYKKQDLGELNRLMEASGGFTMQERGAFLDERNARWIGRMEKKMGGKTVFFAVGAGHLPGQKGVITLLRNAGYKVEPVQ